MINWELLEPRNLTVAVILIVGALMIYKMLEKRLMSAVSSEGGE